MEPRDRAVVSLSAGLESATLSRREIRSFLSISHRHTVRKIMSAAKTLGFYLACILSTILFIRGGVALECYECNSAENQEGENCTDHFDKETTTIKKTQCEANATQCRKIIQEISGERRITRQCANTPGSLNCIERAGTYHIKVWYCNCDHGLCNVASHMTLTFWSVLLVIVGGTFVSVL